MDKQLIINSNSHETRIALLEDGNLVELYIERGSGATILGNIYKGRVNRVLPGMQAAFIDIGLERTAFLYVADVQDEIKNYEELLGISDNGGQSDKSTVEASASIEELLAEGQEILVQVIKEPIGTKGARVSAHISLPGRHLVYMPGAGDVRISRKIEAEEERERLKNIVMETMPGEGGFIIRTAGVGAEKEQIISDMECLLKVWKKVKKKNEKVRPPSVVHHELDITLRAVRDIISEDIDRIVVDSPEEYKKVTDFMENLMPKMHEKVSLYEENEPVFEHFGIEMEIDEVLREKVWLKSGGYIVIQATEALTAVDVNTGRFTGKKNLEDTILKTNLESAREIACQLRLRNLGGIIIIDFIDMMKKENRDKVYHAMLEALKKDRAITRASEISELGLLEMTRKRIRSSIAKVMCNPCDYCEGRGYLKSKESISYEILRGIEKEAVSFAGEAIKVHVHPELSDLLLGELGQDITGLEKKHGVSVSIIPNTSLHIEDYHIH